MLNAKINLNEILEYVTEGKDCKVLIFEDGDAMVYSADIEAKDFSGVAYQLDLEAYDFEKLEGDVEAYRSWLSDGANAVKTDIEIEMDFI